MMPVLMAILFLVVLSWILGVWIYRSIRSLSELAQAPALRISRENIRHGKVTVLIPAKNEEKNIADCVKPFLAQLQSGDEIIVINNCSEDKTEAILQELDAVEMKGTGSELRAKCLFPLVRQEGQSPKTGTVLSPGVPFKYLNTPPTPEGWTGKNFALQLGVQYASGDWLLFTDADTRHEIGSVNAAVAFAEKNQVDLLTLLPRCLAHGFWENLIQPCAMGYIGLWFPIRKINDPRSKIYFGNGQYLLVRKDHYEQLGRHEAVKEAFLEDFALMKKTKQMGAKGICAFGMAIYGTRMYDSFDAIWRGWRRIYLHANEQNFWRLFRSALSVLCFSVLPFLLLPLAFTATVLAAMELILLAIIFATAFKAHSIVRARKSYALLHPFAALVFMLILIDACHMAFAKRPTHWR